MLEAKSEHSKFGTSIVSILAGNNEEWKIFSVSDYPTFMHWYNINFTFFPSAQAGNRKTISADFLSKIRNINNRTATKVLYQNTQLNCQGANIDLSCEFSTNDRILRYKRINCHFFTDTFFVATSVVSTRGNNCIQISVSNQGFVTIHPMRRKGDLPDVIHMFYK